VILGSAVIVRFAVHSIFGNYCVLFVVDLASLNLLILLLLKFFVVELVVVCPKHIFNCVAVSASLIDNGITISCNIVLGHKAALIVGILLSFDSHLLSALCSILLTGILIAAVLGSVSQI
jgi:hypothetical protein